MALLRNFQLGKWKKTHYIIGGYKFHELKIFYTINRVYYFIIDSGKFKFFISRSGWRHKSSGSYEKR